MGIRAESIRARPATPQMPSGLRATSRTAENLCRRAMGASFTESLFYRSGRDLFCAVEVGLGWMLSIAGEEVQGVGQEGEDCAERAFGSPGIAG